MRIVFAVLRQKSARIERAFRRDVVSVVLAALTMSALTHVGFAQAADSVAISTALVSARPAGIQGARVARTPPLTLADSATANELLSDARAFGAATLRAKSSPDKAPDKNAATWWAPVASAIVPGSGQALLRQQRSLAYLVSETFLVIQAFRVNQDFVDFRRNYRDIAANVARQQFGAERPVGPWEYYEILADETVTASGNYNLASSGRFIPESDEATYNGQQWLFARLLYWSNPTEPPAENSAEYKSALSFYQARAWQGSFRWTWRDNQNAKELYVQTIHEANRSKQRGVSMLGLVAANHLLSMVDAYVSVRLRRYGGAGLVTASMNSQLRPSGIAGDNSIAIATNIAVPIPGSGRRP